MPVDIKSRILRRYGSIEESIKADTKPKASRVFDIPVVEEEEKKGCPICGKEHLGLRHRSHESGPLLPGTRRG